ILCNHVPSVLKHFNMKNKLLLPVLFLLFGIKSFAVTIDIDTLYPNPICPDRYLLVFWSLSDTLSGVFEYQMSDGSGSFAFPTSLGPINISNQQLTGGNAVFIPPATLLGNC